MKWWKNKISKLTICSIMSTLLCLNSFAAIVSNTDKSAFMTKAEFDVLKNNFQSQLDAYSNSLDSKIDIAISSYLAGITVETTPTNLWTEIENRNGGPIWFLNGVEDVGSNNIDINKKIILRRQLAAYGVWKFKERWKYWNGTPSAHASAAWSIAVLYSVAGENSTTIDSSAENRVFQTRLEVDRRVSPSGGWYTGGVWSCRDTDVPIIQPPDSYFPTYHDYFTNPTYHDIGLVNSLKTDISAVASSEESGAGAAWLYHLDPDGSEYISEYDPTIFPVINVHAYIHSYQSFKVPQTSSDTRGVDARNNFIQWYETDNGKAYSTMDIGEYTADLPEGYGSKVTSNLTPARIPSDDSTTDNEWYIKTDLSKISISNGVDYTTKQWGLGSDTNIYCLRDIQMPTYSTTEYDSIQVSNMTWTDSYFSQQGRETQTNKLNDNKIKWKKVSIEPAQRRVSDFQNNVLTATAGQKVYNGGGVPLAKFVNDTTSNIKLKLKSSSGTGNVYYMLSDKQFIEGAFDTSARIKKYGTVAVGSEISLTDDFRKDEMLWLNCYSTTSGVEATVESFDITG